MTKRPISFPGRQRGTVLITVILIAAFVIVLVIESTKTVRYQKQLSSNLINRDQAYAYLMGMEELAKIWLKKAFENSKEERVHLNQPWAQDNITFPIDGGLMTASIKDMQSCFNLNTVRFVDPDPNKQNEITATGVTAESVGQGILEEIISQINENSDVQGGDLAASLRDWVDPDIEQVDHRGAEDDYYQSMDVPYRTPNSTIAHSSELLTVKGFNQKLVQSLLPYVCVIPKEDETKLNINTISGESALVMHAALGSKTITLAEVNEALSNRPDDGFESVEKFIQEFGDKGDSITNKTVFDVKSHFFQVTAQAEIGKTRVAMKTLFQKDDSNNFKVVSRYYGKE